MFPIVQSNLEDETLPSLLGRCLEAWPVTSRKRIGPSLGAAYGSKLALDLPTHLSALAGAVGREWGMDAVEIARELTLLPLYAPFMGPERYQALLASMLGKGDVPPTCIIGLHGDPTPRKARLMFCQSCRTQDCRRFGFTWWRRVHQARGVMCCPWHGVALTVSQFPRSDAWKLDYPLADDAKPVRDAETVGGMSKAIAEDVAWLLASNRPPTPPQMLRNAYFEAAEKNGLVKAGRLQRAALREFLTAKIGSKNLYALRATVSPTPYAWPAKLVMGARECHPPLRHILLIRALGSDVKTFLQTVSAAKVRPICRRGGDESRHKIIRELWPRRDVSCNEIVRRVGANYGTVRGWASMMGLPLPRFADERRRRAFERRRAADRRRIMGRSRPPKCAIKWLGRNDRAWLSQHMRRSRRRAPSRIDWMRRDREWAREAPAAIARVLACRPPRRVSIKAVADELGIWTTVQMAAGRLPQFWAAVGKHAEDWRAFALRRIKLIREREPDLPASVVREKSGVSWPLPAIPGIAEALGYSDVRRAPSRARSCGRRAVRRVARFWKSNGVSSRQPHEPRPSRQRAAARRAGRLQNHRG